MTKINLGSRQVIVLHASQNDEGTEMPFEIYIEGIELPITSATFQGMKPSGATFSKSGTVSGNQVTITTDTDLTDEPGRFPVELRLVNGSETIGTVNMDFWVERDPTEGGVT